METRIYNPELHEQKLMSAWYAIIHRGEMSGTPIGFTSRQDFCDWANDPEDANSLAYAINERFHGDNLMAQELQLTKINRGQPYGRSNCRWLTRSEIREREPRTIKFVYREMELTIGDFCEMFDIKKTTARSFVYRKGVDNLTDEMIDAFIANQRLNAKYSKTKTTQPKTNNGGMNYESQLGMD